MSATITLSQQDEYLREGSFRWETRKPAEYCSVLITNGYFTGVAFTGQKKWYWMMEGEVAFCKISRNYRGEINEVRPCYINNSKINIGRGIDIEDCIIK